MAIERRIVFNAIGYQVVWFAAVYGASNGVIWPAMLSSAAFVLWQWRQSPFKQADIKLMLCALLIGTMFDGGARLLHLIDYQADHHTPLAPWWILAIWVSFAITINHSLRIFKRHFWAALLFGAMGGSLAYIGASAKFSVLDFPLGQTNGYAYLIIGWACLLPLLCWLANQFTPPSHPTTSGATHP